MRLGPEGKIVNSNVLIHQEYSTFLKSNAKKCRYNSGHWIEVGHYGLLQAEGTAAGQGRINCIAFHPSNPDILFVGVAAGGLWKCSDYGSTWMPLTDGLPSIVISGVTIDPDNPKRIWTLTGHGNHNWSIGILYSSNSGKTWEKKSNKFQKTL
ncbi:MAG: hypothetical protein AAGA77_18565 [Bacteroidota bacterium]